MGRGEGEGKGKAKSLFTVSIVVSLFTVSARLITDDEIDLGQVYAYSRMYNAQSPSPPWSYSAP